MPKTLWTLTFFFGAPALVIWSFILLTSLSPAPHLQPYPQVLGAATPIYAAADTVVPQVKQSLTTGDARPTIIKNYLARYDSPLEPYADYLIDTSDKYSLDYRLLVAIARQESGLCQTIPEGSHNCWGYGIYGDKITRFADFPQAIDTVARGLKANYLDRGLTTPEEIMAKYTPPSVGLGGPWAKAVNQFLLELE